jgi:hypothetical protein
MKGTKDSPISRPQIKGSGSDKVQEQRIKISRINLRQQAVPLDKKDTSCPIDSRVYLTTYFDGSGKEKHFWVRKVRQSM